MACIVLCFTSVSLPPTSWDGYASLPIVCRCGIWEGSMRGVSSGTSRHTSSGYRTDHSSGSGMPGLRVRNSPSPSTYSGKGLGCLPCRSLSSPYAHLCACCGGDANFRKPWSPQLGATPALRWDPGMLPPPPRGGRGTENGGGWGAMPVAASPGRQGGRRGARERGRQLATAVFKISSMLLGGIKGKKNKTPNKQNKTEKPHH